MLRTCTMQIQKEKVLFFEKKDSFWKILNFFPKGGPFDVETVKKKFLFSKISKTNLKNDFYGTIQT